MVKTGSIEDKEKFEDMVDSLELLHLLKLDIQHKIICNKNSFSFKVDTGLKMFGVPVLELYHVKRYDAFDMTFNVGCTCSVTNKITELKLSEDNLLELTKNMVI